MTFDESLPISAPQIHPKRNIQSNYLNKCTTSVRKSRGEHLTIPFRQRSLEYEEIRSVKHY